MKENRSSSVARELFLSLSCCLLIVAANESASGAQPAVQAPTQTSDVTAAVQSSFGTVLEVVTAFQPFYVTGDFNGDAKEDLVASVRITGARSALQKDVRLLNPFYESPKVTFPANPAAENKLALAIIHSWKTPQTSTKFLLIGEGPILIFDYDRTTHPDGVKGLLSLMHRRGKRPQGMVYPRGARGDVILLATEVGDETPLFWNGRTYRWYEGGYD